MGGLFSNLPVSLPEELVEVLASGAGVRVEKIVSLGHASPPGFWYDPVESEWVCVLQGSAQVRFADPERTVTLAPGDHILLAPHERHRVEQTAADSHTVWLAVFFGGV